MLNFCLNSDFSCILTGSNSLRIKNYGYFDVSLRLYWEGNGRSSTNSLTGKGLKIHIKPRSKTGNVNLRMLWEVMFFSPTSKFLAAYIGWNVTVIGTYGALGELQLTMCCILLDTDRLWSWRSWSEQKWWQVNIKYHPWPCQRQSHHKLCWTLWW